MHIRNVVMNRDQTRVLSIPIKDREKLRQPPVLSAKYSGNLTHSTYFPQKIHTNKHIKKCEKFHGT